MVVIWGQFSWLCGDVVRVGGELCLRKVDALDGGGQGALLNPEFTGGLLERSHLFLDRVDGV
jgi:hypothetical protein